MRSLIRKVNRITTGKTFTRLTAMVAIIAMAVLLPIHAVYANSSSAANDTVAGGAVAVAVLGLAAAVGCPPCAAVAAGITIGGAVLTWLTADTSMVPGPSSYLLPAMRAERVVVRG